jgi:hypothetical protein
MKKILRLYCHDSDGWSPACHGRGPRSIPDVFKWHIWRAKWQWDRFSSQYFGFPPSASFHHCPIFINLLPTLYNLSIWQCHCLTTPTDKDYLNFLDLVIITANDMQTSWLSNFVSVCVNADFPHCLIGTFHENKFQSGLKTPNSLCLKLRRKDILW